MKFSYNWLKEYIPAVSGVKQLIGDLTMRVFEVEEAIEVEKDWVLDIKVLPNRAADCLSHLGIAREIAAIEKIKFKEPAIKIQEEKNLKIKDFLVVEVKDKKLCRRYSARVVVDVKVGDSPAWLKERLQACGLRPINNIVDITNYVMLECGQPLHAFDLDKMTQGVIPSEARDPVILQSSAGLLRPVRGGARNDMRKIIVRRAENGEKIATLDEGKSERALDENILVIADDARAIGIAGIKGGKGPEIDGKTTRVAIEAANFDPVNIRQSSKSLNLRTDASVRFENRVDINLTLWGLDRAADLMRQLAGGKIAAGVIDIAATKSKPALVVAGHGQIESLLGVSIKSGRILDIFRRLDLPVKTIKKNGVIMYEILAPTRRGDLKNAQDLIEEVGRLYGYENIPPQMPGGVLLPVARDENSVYADKIKDILVGLGYSEVYNYSFFSEDDQALHSFKNLVEVINPLSRDQKFLRSNLALGLVKNIKENLKDLHHNARGGNLRLFEVGRVFFQEEKDVFEQKKVGGMIYLKNSEQKNQAFYEIKGVLEILFEKLGLADAWESKMAGEQAGLDLSRLSDIQSLARIKIGAASVGWFARANEKFLNDTGILGQAAIFEIDFSQLVKLVDEERMYRPPSKFPANIRDLSVLVEAAVKVEEILNTVNAAAGPLLEDIDLFDLYEGNNLSDDRVERGLSQAQLGDKKSLAFHLVFQSNEKNLSDAEVNKIMASVIKAVEEKGWEVRK